MPAVDHFGETHVLVESGLDWLLWNIACCSFSCILSHLDGFYFFPSYSNHSLPQGTKSISLGYSYFCKLSAAPHMISPSLPFHRGKPEIIGSNLDILVTVGLSDKACEDYRLPQEVCNAISKLASNPKVRLWISSLGHQETKKWGKFFIWKREVIKFLQILKLSRLRPFSSTVWKA